MAQINLNLKKSLFVPKFQPLLTDYSHRWEFWCGSAGSGKSYTIAQKLIIRCCSEPMRVLVCRRYATTLRNSCFALFKEVLAKWQLSSYVQVRETDMSIIFPNGSQIIMVGLDTEEKLLSLNNISTIWIEEAYEVEKSKVEQLNLRMRGTAANQQLLLSWNPISKQSWLYNFTVEEPPENSIFIHSTYKDNPFLTAEQVREIEDNKNDEIWWKVYGQGLEGTLDGLIYDFEQIDALPPKGVNKPESEKSDEEKYADSLVEIHGLDFGFTNDPTARVQILADPKRKHLFVRERCYQTHMQNKHIIEDLNGDGVGRNVEIFADCAEPKSIKDIQDGGFRVVACDKDAPVKSDKLKFQLQWMQGWKLFVTKDSLNLINELRNYVWLKDKDGKPLNIPIDKFNHLLDAMRYAVWTKWGVNAGKGEYHISVSNKRKRR